ncbi:MAG: beta-lactamase family protein [Xanthomonadales bacterium]|nr:beta-lactamase family protein [Xanthomonadales bacterium]
MNTNGEKDKIAAHAWCRAASTLIWIALLLPMWCVAASLDKPAETAFDAQFRRTMERTGIPGGAYAIIRRDEEPRFGALGVRSLDRPDEITPDTVFRIASLSKTFTAALVAQAVRDGTLAWDLPLSVISRHVTVSTHWRPATLEDALGHTTGYVPYAFDTVIDGGGTFDEALHGFERLAPICAPGRCFAYQNVLFNLATPALESASGHAFRDLLQARIAQPLQMMSTTVGHDAFVAETNRADPHIRRGEEWTSVPDPVHYDALPAAAGVNSSARDLSKWLSAHLGAAPDVLTEKQIAAVTAERVRMERTCFRNGGECWPTTRTMAWAGACFA